LLVKAALGFQKILFVSRGLTPSDVIKLAFGEFGIGAAEDASVY
jgi:hypothetical protein